MSYFILLVVTGEKSSLGLGVKTGTGVPWLSPPGGSGAHGQNFMTMRMKYAAAGCSWIRSKSWIGGGEQTGLRSLRKCAILVRHSIWKYLYMCDELGNILGNVYRQVYIRQYKASHYKWLWISRFEFWYLIYIFSFFPLLWLVPDKYVLSTVCVLTK